MNQNNRVAFKVWSVLYPVGMYYVAITMGSFVAQVILGTGIETYMLCKIIGSLVAIPVVWSFYKQDLIFEGTYRLKQEFNKEFWKNIELLDKQINESNIEKSFSGIEYIKTIKQFNKIDQWSNYLLGVYSNINKIEDIMTQKQSDTNKTGDGYDKTGVVAMSYSS